MDSDERRYTGPILSRDPLDAAVDAILSVCSPSRIILYGPWVRGVRDFEVPMNLIVVLERSRNLSEVSRRVIIALARAGVSGRAIVVTSKLYEDNIDVKFSEVYEAYRYGKVLYGARTSR